HLHVLAWDDRARTRGGKRAHGPAAAVIAFQQISPGAGADDQDGRGGDDGRGVGSGGQEVMVCADANARPAPARLAFLALLGGATGIGFAPVLVRLSEVGPGATAFFRLLFALPWLWLWMRLEARKVDAPRQP